jgi:hypothetical protein
MNVCLAITDHLQIHAAVWPAVLDTLRRSHIVDYSIHLLPSPPFAVAGSPNLDLAGLLIATFKYIGMYITIVALHGRRSFKPSDN